MGKRKEFDKDFEYDYDIGSPPPHKKHKKHKKHKRKVPEYEEPDIDVVNDTPVRTPQREPEPERAKAAAPAASTSKSTPPSVKASKKRKGRSGKDSGTSSDEERWLDAIESGKLEEVDDELKKIKDPKLMTARQRAMYERGNDKETIPGGEILMSLPTGYKEKVMTAEAIQKAQLKSQKRKQQADEKREMDKKKTMERLLKKQETKQRSQGKNRMARVAEPMISYRNNAEGAVIVLPPDHEFPLKAQQQRDPPKPIMCSADGCTNLKVYNCSRTQVPLCSFRCYKRNQEAIRAIMC